MATTTENFNNNNNNDALLQRCLLDNMDKVLAYFKQSVGMQKTNSQQIQDISKRVSELTTQIDDLKQKMENTEQKYREFVYDNENDNINALRGDNGLVVYYKEKYNNLFREIQVLQKQLAEQNELLAPIQRFELLTQILDAQVKADEAQIAINWQQTAAYDAINRYDNDKEDDDSNVNYESMLRDYRARLDNLCAKALTDKEIRTYLNILIAEQHKRKIQSGNNPHHRKR